MLKNGIYFAKPELYELIRECGGVWNDNKQRPIVCILESKECKGLYYAIPLGVYNHRDDNAKQRIHSYISLPSNRIESCYYHLGKTTVQSIFFISDVVPIIDKYIDREYLSLYSKQHFLIKNKILLKELERKLLRILSFENSKPNHFRQHITDVKNKLIEELK